MTTSVTDLTMAQFIEGIAAVQDFNKNVKALRGMLLEIIDRLDELETVAASAPVDAIPHREMSVKEAAEYLRLKPSTVYHLVKEGKLPHYRTATGRGLVFTESELHEYKNSRGVKKVMDTPYERGRAARRYLEENPGPKLPAQP